MRSQYRAMHYIVHRAVKTSNKHPGVYINFTLRVNAQHIYVARETRDYTCRPSVSLLNVALIWLSFLAILTVGYSMTN